MNLLPTGKFFSYNVKVCETFSIPSQTECCLCMKVDCINASKEGMFNPFKLKLAQLGIIAAQSLAISSDNLIPIRLFNLRENDVYLYKNTVIGSFEFKTENSFENSDICVMEKNNDLYDFENMLKNEVGSNNCLTEDQKIKLKDLLTKFKNVFSSNKLIMVYVKI